MIIENIKKSVEFIQSKTSILPTVGITLGSGLAHFVDEVSIDAEIPFTDIPGFAPPTVEGHPGKLVIGHVAETPVAILQGRIHYYEGHSPQQVVHPTRVLAKLGCNKLIFTNAAGGIQPDMTPGSFVLIRDHINLTGVNPLLGKNINELGPRFLDMTEPYDVQLSDKLEDIMKKKNVPYINGVYCWFSGPTYETAAEVQYAYRAGGTCVGMSTVPEVIAARHMGAACIGISCVTNLGTGLSKEKLSHEEVKDVANKVQSQFCDFLSAFVKQL